MEKVRLQKVIASRSAFSRRKAEDLIVSGKVRVNGQVVVKLGTRVDPKNDQVELEQQALEVQKKVYYLFYKPRGVVSTLYDPQKRKTLREFVGHISERLFPVGRLDYLSEGLMLLTNDGELAQRLAHPSGLVKKTYHVSVAEDITLLHIKKLRQGGMVEGQWVKPVSVARILKEDALWLEFILREGRKHEIRTLCEQVGLQVTQLVRVAIGAFMLENLRPGELKAVDREFVLSLFNSLLNWQGSGERPLG
ncbi:MAG: rRNA pseudouridine synthase [Deltaproteobacteria bacterium]|nr:rRNA pseudouridine synthase [Deltaproteobacteria bacterium]